MNIKFNGKPVSVSQTVLSDLLKDRELLDRPGIAVAVNNSVVRKSDWAQTSLKENDQVLIITATQGG